MDVIEQINSFPIREYIEKNPHVEHYDSLRIHDGNNVWRRFSTGQGSSVLDWAGYGMYGTNWDKRSGLNELICSVANQLGIEMNGTDPAISAEKKLLHNIYSAAADYYFVSMEEPHWDTLKSRYGFSEEFVTMQSFGYAPTHGLIAYLSQCKFSIEEMLLSGLVCESSDGAYYEYFRGRLMFPYWYHGNIVNFIGRETDDTPSRERTKGQKYRKIAKRSDYHKNTSEQIQHGIFIGEDSLSRNNKIYLCEGTTDALLAIQYGHSAVSPGGTGYSKDAILRVLDMVAGKDVAIAFDGDEQGRAGATKLATALWESGIIADVLMLEHGDLNDYLRSGGNITDVPRCDLLDLVCRGADKDAEMLEAGRLISCIKKEYLRDEYKKKAAQLIDVPLADIELPSDVLPGEIVINDRQYAEIIDDALDAMAQHNEQNTVNPPFLSNRNSLARVITNEDGRLTIHHYEMQDFKIELARAAAWVQIRETKKSEVKSHARPPADATAGILALRSWPSVSPIRTISQIPLFDVNGVLHRTYGYHRNVKAFVDAPEIKAFSIDESKNWLLDNMLIDFPFSDQASRAHAVAQILQPFVRQMIRGVTPAYITTAPAQGTGKSLLSDLGSIIAQGHAFQWQNAPDNNEEWRKMIMAMMLSGNPFVAIDNCSTIDSDALASMITSHIYNGRVLGQSRNVDVPNEDKTIVMNGNNVILSADIIRRCVLIRIDAETARPWERRQFKIEEILDWADENRADLISACVGVVQHWIDAGRPKYKGKRRGSFEQWSEIMGGILESAGIEGFLENDDELFQTSQNSADEEWFDLVDAWWSEFGEKSVTVADLMPLATYNEDNTSIYDGWKNILEMTLGGGNESIRKRRFANYLAGKRDSVIGDYKICLDTPETKSKKSKQYRLKRLSDSLLDDLDI